MINFVFENIQAGLNFVDCTDLNKSGISRFAPSPLVGIMRYNTAIGHTTAVQYTAQPADDVIISSGVNHDPVDWTGAASDRWQRKSLFNYLNNAYIDRLRAGRALLLIDQSLEGYQTTWLWQWFHEQFIEYNIPPESVVYVTGNTIAHTQYSYWAKLHAQPHMMKVIPYVHFEQGICGISKAMGLTNDFDNKVSYKQTHDIKTFNCLQKRARPHRSWFYLYLFKNDLLKSGLISTNDYGTHIPAIENRRVDVDLLLRGREHLPLIINDMPNTTQTDHHYINRILDTVCADTWVSVVSEASFSDDDNTIFLSEKIFKPIACMHPFIIVGNRDSLKKLRELGYKTFDGYIDESYDSLPTFERFDAIVHAIKKVDAIEDKLAWYKSMQEILEHNYQVLHDSIDKISPGQQELVNYYHSYFQKDL